MADLLHGLKWPAVLGVLLGIALAVAALSSGCVTPQPQVRRAPAAEMTEQPRLQLTCQEDRMRLLIRRGQRARFLESPSLAFLGENEVGCWEGKLRWATR